jgi:hypothetical protein
LKLLAKEAITKSSCMLNAALKVFTENWVSKRMETSLMTLASITLK